MRREPSWVPVVLFTLMIAGCSSVPLPIPVTVPTKKDASVFDVNDGRRIVTMGAAYNRFEDPQVDWAEARQGAAEMCRKRHSVDSAEPVGATRRECVKQVGSNCEQYAILGDYRCR